MARRSGGNRMKRQIVGWLIVVCVLTPVAALCLAKPAEYPTLPTRQPDVWDREIPELSAQLDALAILVAQVENKNLPADERSARAEEAIEKSSQLINQFGRLMTERDLAEQAKKITPARSGEIVYLLFREQE